jgi:hypothetical protein
MRVVRMSHSVYWRVGPISQKGVMPPGWGPFIPVIKGLRLDKVNLTL